MFVAAFARSLAVSAGAKASQFAAPGQMERAISQAAAAAASVSPDSSSFLSSFNVYDTCAA